MRAYPPEIIAHIAARRPLLVHAMVWLTAKDRITGEAESIGLWTGADHQEIVVAGEARTYHGVGSILGLDNFVSQAKGHEQTWSLQVSSLHEQVIEALRLYDARLAPVEVHSYWFDPATERPLADPVREFRGTVMSVDLPTPPVGGEAKAVVKCVSDAWKLTRPLTLKRSQAAIAAMDPLDTFRQYNTISGSVETAWGSKRKGPPEAKASMPSHIDENGR